jgi:hypothetical protein
MQGSAASDNPDSGVPNHSNESLATEKYPPDLPYQGCDIFADFTGRLFMSACAWIEVLATWVKEHQRPVRK